MGLHLILVSRVVKHMDVIAFSVGQFFTAGLLFIFKSFWLHMPYDGLTSGWRTILYIGLLSTAGGYTIQVFGQKYAPPADAIILLSMEAVFAALTGFIFLGETMLPVQLVGGGLILVAVIVTQMNAVRLNSAVIKIAEN